MTSLNSIANAPVRRALILAAGRGERMRPLTDQTPKPLLSVHGQPLIVWHLQALAQAGICDVVINTAWLGEQFEPLLGDGSLWGLRLHYSHEGVNYGQALETAGGLATAWQVLDQIEKSGKIEPQENKAMWLISGDIFAPNWEFSSAIAQQFVQSTDWARIWLVPNPDFHPNGDFDIEGDRAIRATQRPWTYANIALVKPDLVAQVQPGERSALGPHLFEASAQSRLAAQCWNEAEQGPWFNVGTPQQLSHCNAQSVRVASSHAG